MSKSPYKIRARGTLKEATQRLVTACGGLKAAAEGTRVSTQSLFRYTDESEENRDRFVPVDIVRQLEARCGLPVVTEFLAHAAGVGLTQASGPVTAGDVAVQVATAAREAADVFAAAAVGLADGTVTAPEAGAMVGEIDEALAAFALLRSAATRIAEGAE